MDIVSGVTAAPENKGQGHSGEIVSADVRGNGHVVTLSCAEWMMIGADADSVAGADFTEARGILGAALPVGITELPACWQGFGGTYRGVAVG